VNGLTQAGRNHFAKNANKDEQLLSLIFCNLSTLFSTAVKVGNRFNSASINIHVAQHYQDAIERALELCDQFNLKQSFLPFDQAILYNHSGHSLTPTCVYYDKSWNNQTSEYANNTIIINRYIMHSISKGYMEPKHVPLIVQMRNKCKAQLPAGNEIEYIIVDSREQKGASRAARNQFVQSLKEWHQQHPFKMYILYGTNSFMRTAARLASPFMPFTIKVVEDRNEAFKIVMQHKFGQSKKKKSKQTKTDTSDSTKKNIEKLLAFIGSINWEQEDKTTEITVDKNNPFYILFQSIKLINEELYSLFEDRKKAMQDLNESNIQLQAALSELKQTQEKMVQQERLAAVGQLAAGIAHDFNNILAGISGFSELMHVAPNTPSTMQPKLKKIITSCKRASNLVGQLLDFSRKSFRQPIKIDPAEFIEDAMPSGGQLRFDLSQIYCIGNLECDVCNKSIEGEWIQLIVSDTGSGISEKVQSHIFEPFFTTKEIGKGSGLGLSQVAGIVAQHSGHIRVENQSGRGTTFTVYFPVASASDEITPEQESPQMKQGNGETILLVEDEPTVLQVMTEMLELLGYQLLTAVNGEKAISSFKESEAQIDLVLSDMVMPDMDGEMLFNKLKTENRDLKMILMSGYPLGKSGANLLEQGVVSWFKKPISFEQLAQIVGTALSNRKGRYS
jgi:signal transduction histidine kinase/ActR/RegA family two-component response regulator